VTVGSSYYRDLRDLESEIVTLIYAAVWFDRERLLVSLRVVRKQDKYAMQYRYVRGDVAKDTRSKKSLLPMYKGP